MREWRDRRFTELDALIAADEERQFRQRLKYIPLRGFRAQQGELTDQQRSLISAGVPHSFFQPDSKPRRTGRPA